MPNAQDKIKCEGVEGAEVKRIAESLFSGSANFLPSRVRPCFHPQKLIANSQFGKIFLFLALFSVCIFLKVKVFPQTQKVKENFSESDGL